VQSPAAPGIRKLPGMAFDPENGFTVSLEGNPKEDL
jgi:hypothetical protein